MNKFVRQAIFYLLTFMIVVAIFSNISSPDTDVEEIRYDELVAHIERGQVREGTLTGNVLEGTLTDDTEFRVYIPPEAVATIIEKMDNVPLTTEPEPSPPWYTSLLGYMIPFIILIAIFFFFMQQTQGGGNRVMNFGKSRARLHEAPRKKVTFESVAGADEEKAELVEVVEFLKEPKKFLDLGARIPKGVLLVGPPGTGKTLLARAVAGEAGVPFFSISGSDFVEMFVGVGASRVRDLFENAKKNAPCIVFIDEIDAVGRQRGAGLGGGHDEREQTLNQLLVEMDGFDVHEGIIIIAATNRPDILDPALLRPGRFDRQVTVHHPDVKGREAILKVHARGKPLQNLVELQVVARRTPGFTGADLENVINEGALLAGRKNKREITMDELEEAIDRVIAGTEKKSRVITPFEKKLVAYHEAGHALVGYLLPLTDPVHKVSIIPRGRSGGYTLMLPEQDRYYMTKSELLDRITALLSGRVAEQLVLNDISTGAQNDLERATQMVRQMITEYGMSDELGPITLGKSHEQQVFLGRDIARDRDYSDEIAYAIDKELRHMVDRCYRKAQDILEKNRDKLDILAKGLMEKEALDAEEIKAIMEGAGLDGILALAKVKKAEEEIKQQERDGEADRERNPEKGVRIMVNDKDLESTGDKEKKPPR